MMIESHTFNSVFAFIDAGAYADTVVYARTSKFKSIVIGI